MPATRSSFRRRVGKWRPTSPTTSAAGARPSLQLHYYSVSDIVDFIPIDDDQQGVGNLPHADRLGFKSTSTFNLDPIGWSGAKLDATFAAEWTKVRDPLTAKGRPISGVEDRWGSLGLRHDIPHTQLAWGAYVQYQHYVSNYYLTEIDHTLDIPWMEGFYVEDKNVHGLTVRFTVDNIFNGRHLEYRKVWDGFPRPYSALFHRKSRRLVGPLFTLSVKGNF